MLNNKHLTILAAVLFVLLLFSLFIYSSTYNTFTQNRLIRLGDHQAVQTQPGNSSDDEVTEGVYGEFFDDEIENIPSVKPFITPLTQNEISKDSSKIVYLTIDDGPAPGSTANYLRILRENEAKATFFMIGSRMERYPELVKQIDSDGHAIGNHSYSHNYSILYKNTENFTKEILKSEDIIFSITGKRPKIFRAPGGSTKIRDIGIDTKLTELGYAVFDWNVSAADTDPSGVTKSEVVYNIEHESRGLKRVIVLMHDNPSRKASQEALPEVIKWFKQKGYEFKTLDENTPSIRLKRRIKIPAQEKASVDKSVYQNTGINN